MENKKETKKSLIVIGFAFLLILVGVILLLTGNTKSIFNSNDNKNNENNNTENNNNENNNVENNNTDTYTIGETSSEKGGSNIPLILLIVFLSLSVIMNIVFTIAIASKKNNQID